MRTGLDHMAEGVWTVASKGIDARHEMNASCTRSLPKAVSTIRDPCWQRPDLTLEVVVLSDISDAWSGTGRFTHRGAERTCVKYFCHQLV
jgi:hypothetical protein